MRLPQALLTENFSQLIRREDECSEMGQARRRAYLRTATCVTCLAESLPKIWGATGTRLGQGSWIGQPAVIPLPPCSVGRDGRSHS